MVTPKEARDTANIIEECAGDYSQFEKTIGRICASNLRDLANQVESLQADAERYRWLRETWAFTIYEDLLGLETNRLIDSDLDSAIDEARKQS